MIDPFPPGAIRVLWIIRVTAAVAVAYGIVALVVDPGLAWAVVPLMVLSVVAVVIVERGLRWRRRQWTDEAWRVAAMTDDPIAALAAAQVLAQATDVERAEFKAWVEAHGSGDAVMPEIVLRVRRAMDAGHEEDR